MKLNVFKNRTGSILLISTALLFTINTFVSAQPSGGPYGPVLQNYELPKVTGKIYFVSPQGNADVTGESLNKPTTIEAAIEKVKTGDAIVMRGGIYRTGNLLLNQGITIQPYSNERPILKGTFIATEWTDLNNGLWTTSWNRLFPSKPADWWRRHREGKKTPLHRFNDDMVFVDGRFLQSAGWEGEVDENSFYVDYDEGKIYIGVNPENHQIEITAYNVAVHRVTSDVHGKTSDKKGPVIRGITFTQYAYRAFEFDGAEPEGVEDESKFGNDVTGTMLENCEISYCSRVAGYFRGDHLTIKNCKISNTSTEGIFILNSSDVLLEKNIFTKNNIERITGYYPAAVKIFNQCYRVTCRDNLVIDLPYSNGIWYDVGNVDGVFVNNWIEGVGLKDRVFSKDRPWPSDNGFFFEISKGVICAGNLFVNCEQGIFILNSSGARIYNNTLINSTVTIGRDARRAEGDHFGWHPSTGPDVDKRENHEFVNNILSGDEGYNRPLLNLWQPSSMCNQLKNPQVKKLDFNIYIKNNETDSLPMIIWSPAGNEECREFYMLPDDLNKKYPQFGANSQYMYGKQIFRSHELGNYQIQRRPDYRKADEIPADIKNELRISKKQSPYHGAFPIVQ
jgi:parallel beta-helix repeat protein